jgi:uncharacterized membrane protein
VTVAGFVLVPADTPLPIHWGIGGEADWFVPRDLALLMLPLVAALVVGLLVGLQRAAGAERVRASRHAVAAVVPALLGLFVAIQASIVSIGLDVPVDMPRVIVAGIGVLFVVMGNILPKTQQNLLAGVRLPWTLGSPANWQATNRLAGMLMLAGGGAMVLVAVLTGATPILVAVTLIAALAPVIVATVYSWRMARRS